MMPCLTDFKNLRMRDGKMSDFFQNGNITTLHNLSRRPVEEIEAELDIFSKQRPLSLVLPSLYSELSGPALANIVKELAKVSYLSEIVIGLDRANKEEYQHALGFLSALPQPHRVLWNDGPRLQKIDEEFGLHDCDIITYDRELLARLMYPVANPQFNYEFCKGYYSRWSDGKINGRVSRLLVTPLIRTLKRVCGPLDYLEFMDSFRYPLAGEFSFRVDVINDMRIPSDWGLEIGVLSEMYRNYSTNHLCQVDIADAYDHKHQDVSHDDADKGLSKMSVDISKALFRKLATNGVVFSKGTFRTIKASYYRIALDFIDAYHSDSLINGLELDIHEEERSVELFANNIMEAGKYFLDNPMETPFIPSWNRVVSAIPDILPRLEEAVELDNKEFSE